MKILFLTTDSETEELAQTVGGQLFESLDQLTAGLDGPAVVFVDLDNCDDDEAVESELAEQQGIFVVAYSAKWSAKDMKKLQQKRGFDGLLKGPLGPVAVVDAIADFASYDDGDGPQGNEATFSHHTSVEDLTFVGVVNSTKSAITAPKITQGEGDATTINAALGSQDLEDLLGEDDDQDAQAFSAVQVFSMDTNVKSVLKSHQAEANLDGDKINAAIQAKFDQVFEDESFPEQHDPTEFEPIPEEDLPVGPVSGIGLDFSDSDDVASLDFGDDEEVSEIMDIEEVSDNVIPLKGKSGEEASTGGGEISLPEILLEDDEENQEDQQFEVESQDLENEVSPGIQEAAMSTKDNDQDSGPEFELDLGEDMEFGTSLDEDETPSEAAASTEESSDLDGSGGFELDAIEDIALDDDVATAAGAASATASNDDDLGLSLDDDSPEIGEEEPAQAMEVEGGLELGDGGVDDDLVLEEVSAESAGEPQGDGLELSLDVADDDLVLEDSSGAEVSAQAESGDDLDLDIEDDLEVSATAEATGDIDIAELDRATSTDSIEAQSEGMTEFNYKVSAPKESDSLDLDDDLDLDASADEELNFDGSELQEASSPNFKMNADSPTAINDDILMGGSDSTDEDGPQFDISSENERAGPPISIGSEIAAARINEDELVRLQATIRHLREEREELLKEVEGLKSEKRLIQQENLGLKAELDDLRIELSIIKKRNTKESDELRERARVAEEKRAVYEEKARHYQREFDKLGQKVRVDLSKVKKREKELESQLELQSMDSESQVRSRDQKILDLKRKIDALEFNMEHAQIREQKSREDKQKLEERLNKIIGTLRGSIKLLEDDLDVEEELLDKLNKL